MGFERKHQKGSRAFVSLFFFSKASPSDGAAGLLFGAAVGLLIASVVLFSAGVSRWSQDHCDGYAERTG